LVPHYSSWIIRLNHFTDDLHDFLEVAISKLPLFSSGDSVVVKKHLGLFTRIMIIYCRPPQYNHEDVKMRLFVLSLEDDALNWFNNCPEDSFTSLQDIVDAFKDRYGDPDSSPCAPKIVQQNENNLIKGPTVDERFQNNSSYQNVPSTCTIADQIHDSGKARTNYKISVDNEKEAQKQIIQELMQLVKNMDINQINYANDVRTLCTHLEKCNKEMEIMKIKHSDYITDMQNQHANEIEAMKTNHDTEISFMQSKLSGLEENMTTMQANHKKEINSMQRCLMTIKEKDDKVIKDMEANQICLQNKLLTMEEDHAREISAMKVEHSSQMDAITIQVQKFQ